MLIKLILAFLSVCLLSFSAQAEFRIWANSGENKIPRQDRPCFVNGAGSVYNSVWDGTQIRLFAAKNEVVAFSLIVEAALKDEYNLSFQLQELASPDGYKISNRSPDTVDYLPLGNRSNNLDSVFDYNYRNIETFVVRYLPIKGLSLVGYDSSYDERHIPVKFRRPFNANFRGVGSWVNRPDHDKEYPDIAVPQEIYGAVNVLRNTSQMIWFDIYVPKNTPKGIYSGTINVMQNAKLVMEVPIKLRVASFALPDEPTAKTMLYLGYPDIAKRYLGRSWDTGQEKYLETIRDRHFQMAHRHRISLIDDNESSVKQDSPNEAWLPRLNGQLFTRKFGYNGAGLGVGNDVFAIGMYGKWDWGNQPQLGQHADNWVNWFSSYAPKATYFVYLIDESTEYAQTEAMAKAFKQTTGKGKNLLTFATIPANIARQKVPSLDIAASTGGMGITAEWQKTVEYYKKNGHLWLYNGARPMTGSFMIDDDGVALRQLAWAQYKMGIERWFYWESTYYNNFQGASGETDVWRVAHTFGKKEKTDASLGETGWNYSNGDGVLFYPGTDKVFLASSYNLAGPVASLRLKYWRRGLQDVDYLFLAAKRAPQKVKTIVEKVIPKVLWEYGVNDPKDPTWVTTDISWSTNPDVWEAARQELFDILNN